MLAWKRSLWESRPSSGGDRTSPGLAIRCRPGRQAERGRLVSSIWQCEQAGGAAQAGRPGHTRERLTCAVGVEGSRPFMPCREVEESRGAGQRGRLACGACGAAGSRAPRPAAQPCPHVFEGALRLHYCHVGGWLRPCNGGANRSGAQGLAWGPGSPRSGAAARIPPRQCLWVAVARGWVPRRGSAHREGRLQCPCLPGAAPEPCPESRQAPASRGQYRLAPVSTVARSHLCPSSCLAGIGISPELPEALNARPGGQARCFRSTPKYREKCSSQVLPTEERGQRRMRGALINAFQAFPTPANATWP